MQKDKVYISDVAVVNKICNETFSDSKVFTQVRLITKLYAGAFGVTIIINNTVYVYLNNSLIYIAKYKKLRSWNLQCKW